MQIISFKYQILLIKTLNIIEKSQKIDAVSLQSYSYQSASCPELPNIDSELMLRHIPFIHWFKVRLI